MLKDDICGETRPFTPAEVARLVRFLRQGSRWTQDTLATEFLIAPTSNLPTNIRVSRSGRMDLG